MSQSAVNWDLMRAAQQGFDQSRVTSHQHSALQLNFGSSADVPEARTRQVEQNLVW